MADHRVVGKAGRVTGRIGPDSLGEVMVAVRGGSEAFHAYNVDRSIEITTGTQILVLDYLPPRTVVVTPL